jgi:hypothetical protein
MCSAAHASVAAHHHQPALCAAARPCEREHAPLPRLLTRSNKPVRPLSSPIPCTLPPSQLDSLPMQCSTGAIPSTGVVCGALLISAADDLHRRQCQCLRTHECLRTVTYSRPSRRTTSSTVMSRPVVSTAVSNCFVTTKSTCAEPLTSASNVTVSAAARCCPVTRYATPAPG